MNTSAELNLLNKSFISMNKVLHNPKNTAVNPFFKSKYAPLNDILSEVRPILAEYGLSILQNTSTSPDGEKIGIQTMLIHESGQFISSDVMYIKSDKDTAQGQGSAITYGRRYQLSAMLSIASEDDDDGNTASQTKSQSVRKEIPAEIKSEFKKGNQIAALQLIEKLKTEKDLDKFLIDRKTRSWTPEEIEGQDALISIIRDAMKAENKQLEAVI